MIKTLPETKPPCYRGLLLVACIVIFLFSSTRLRAQSTVVKDAETIKGTSVVIPGIEYKRSGYHNFWSGKHYRKEWITPVRVNNFYLDTAAGGLTPSEEGGSRQSKTLRLKNSAGKEYVLRSVNKDFGRAFPEIYQGTFVTRSAKDQASIGYPYAAITITPMIEVTGIYHTNPRIVFVPEQPALGKFNKKYGNELYLFEERADENLEDAEHFGRTKNAVGSEKLFENIYKDSDHQVDQKAFVKARLFDMFIGDWSRHPDQWRWAKFEDGDKKFYKPIPRDRDQAYTKFDGFWPSFATKIAGATHLESFGYDIRNVKNFNKPARLLDRRFTNELTKEDWVNTAKELQQVLTDRIIEDAVHQTPPEVFDISGPEIIAKLKSRRDHLTSYAESYYKFLAMNAELTGSNKKELFEINRPGNGQTQVSIYKITAENEVKKKPYYSRTFNSGETKELLIYGLDKEDIFKFEGDQNDGIRIKIIDAEGIDSFPETPKGRTRLFSGKKFEFDSLHQKKFGISILPLMSPPEYKVFEEEPLPLFTNTGAKISANLMFNPQPWRKEEYKVKHVISANYGFLRSAFNVGYIGRFGYAIGKWDFLLKARADLPAVENYFGTGNESVKENSTRNFYRTTSTRYYGGLGLERNIGSMHTINVSTFYQNVKVKPTEGHFISDITYPDPLAFESKQYGGAEASYHFRKTNREILPTGGFDFSLAAGYIQNLDQSSRSFTNILSTIAVYIPLGKSFSIASRAGGATLAGDADFYHLNKLSGNKNLRGYDKERFSGKSIFYNNNELRWITDTKNYFFNGKIGLLVFFDEGRVWQPLETSDKWHTSYGGGLILSPFNKIVLTGTYGISEEGKQLLLKAGLFF